MAAHVSPEYQRDYKRRLLERAPKIPCECGCGELMPAIKANGTPRRFINGHVSPDRCSAWAKQRRLPPPKRYVCPDCGGERSRDAMRCWDCSLAVQAGTSSSAYSRYAREHLKDACERCEATEDLDAHHRDRDRSNNAPENIETLCRSCHGALHRAERAAA